MINERIAKLRKLMKANDISAYIVPSSDPHQSEYLADYYKTREFITGFTGSAGCAVITMKKSALFTDGRYFLQAENELSKMAGVLIDQKTKGPQIKSNYETNVKGIFAAGNVLQVHDLVDKVSEEAERAATNICKYLEENEKENTKLVNIKTDSNISYILPQSLVANEEATHGKCKNNN